MSDLSIVGRLKLLEKQFVLDGRLSDANTVQMAADMIEMLKSKVAYIEGELQYQTEIANARARENIKLSHHISPEVLTSLSKEDN